MLLCYSYAQVELYGDNTYLCILLYLVLIKYQAGICSFDSSAIKITHTGHIHCQEIGMQFLGKIEFLKAVPCLSCGQFQKFSI